MWGYYWVHTAAQIELGLIDCPIIVYERGKKRKGGKGEGPEFEKAWMWLIRLTNGKRNMGMPPKEKV